jgi:hypothetical protein
MYLGVVEHEQRFLFGLLGLGLCVAGEAGARFFGAQDAHAFHGRTFVVVQVAHVFLNLPFSP